MKIQESAENYLETILMLSQRGTDVRSIDIANELDFSKPSVSIAMKNLRENGYITGLGVDPKTAVEDACRIEHVISAESFDALKRACATHTELDFDANRE